MKKKLFLFFSLMAGIIALASIVLTSINPDPAYRANAETKSYGITFDSTKNKLHNYDDGKAHDGEAIVKTDLGSDINFSYWKLKTKDDSWHSLTNISSFFNLDPIHGMKSITITSNTDGIDCEIVYSYQDITSGENYWSYKYVSKKDEKMTFDFDGYFPNYFLVRNDDSRDIDYDIASIDVSLTCIDNPMNYPFLNVVNEDENLGTVYGSGIQKPGSSVTIHAYPNQGISFAGWYDQNDELVSTEQDYSFIMSLEDIVYKAKFIKAYLLQQMTKRWELLLEVVFLSTQIKFKLRPQQKNLMHFKGGILILIKIFHSLFLLNLFISLKLNNLVI